MEKWELSHENAEDGAERKSAKETAPEFVFEHRLADDVTAEIAEAQAERERYKQRGQKLVDGNRFNFELFAESAAPRFLLSDGFYMRFDKKEVHMNAAWFQERAFSDQQLLWATYHELAHFYDFANDPRAIMNKFEQMQGSARNTGAALAEQYAQLHGGALPEEAVGWLEQKPLDPKRPKKGTMNRFEQIAYGIHHEFWNCMDDIHVNSLVAKRKQAYGESGRHAEEVGRLYREQLFKETDFSSLPRHKQFAYALLRRDMVSDEATVVSEEVEEALARKHRVLGEEYTARELVSELLKARNTLGTNAGTRYGIIEKTLAPVFEELLSKDIADWQFPEPPKELRKEHAGQQEENNEGAQGESESGKQAGEENKKESQGKGAQGESVQKGEGQEGEQQGSGNSQEGEGGEGEGQEEGEPAGGPGAGGEQSGGEQKEEQSPRKSFTENIDDAFNPGKEGPEGQAYGAGKPGGSGGDGPVIPFPIQSPEDMKDIIEQFGKWQKEWEEEQERAKEASKEEPAENREKRLKESRDKEWCEQYDVAYETLKRYEEVERAIKPYLAALDALWQRIIYGSSREVAVQSVGHFKEGEELDIDEVAREFPKILSGELDKVRVMRRDEQVREMVYRPELIRVRFVGDASGSMNEERRAILEQAFVLIFSSLRRFETYLNLTRGKTKSKLSVDTEAWVFGSDAKRVKPFRVRGDHNREKAGIIRSFGTLLEGHGGTRDDKALSAIAESLTPGEMKKIKSEKIMELVFELTDGGTNSEGIAAAKEALAELEQKGAVARAFQIGTTDEDEQKTFNHVWNTDKNGSPLREKRGEVVGAEIKNLIPALTRALAQFLSRVEL